MKVSSTLWQNIESNKIFSSYQKVLLSFWEKKYKDVILSASKLIASFDEKKQSIPIGVFYRVWIESLAETKDYASLRILKDHLLGSFFEKNPDDKTALVALIHLELDEVEACQLYTTALKSSNSRSCYFLELEDRLRMRFLQEEKQMPVLSQSKKPLFDFFHWK